MEKIIAFILALALCASLSACSGWNVEIKDPESGAESDAQSVYAADGTDVSAFTRIDLDSGEENNFHTMTASELAECTALLQTGNWEALPEDWQGKGGLIDPITCLADDAGRYLYVSTEPDSGKTLIQIKTGGDQVCWLAPIDVAGNISSFAESLA